MYKFLSLALIGLLGTLLVASDVHAQITPAQIPLRITTPAVGAKIPPGATINIVGTGKAGTGVIVEVRLVRMAAQIAVDTKNPRTNAAGDWDVMNFAFNNGHTFQAGDMVTMKVATPATGEQVIRTWTVNP